MAQGQLDESGGWQGTMKSFSPGPEGELDASCDGSFSCVGRPLTNVPYNAEYVCQLDKVPLPHCLLDNKDFQALPVWANSSQQPGRERLYLPLATLEPFQPSDSERDSFMSSTFQYPGGWAHIILPARPS